MNQAGCVSRQMYRLLHLHSVLKSACYLFLSHMDGGHASCLPCMHESVAAYM